MDDPLLRLPPLDPLRGFVAAARSLSFTRAAAQLCLTQSAVSRQIQTLEEALGVSLFVRGTRALSLTPEGERLYRLASGWLRDYGELAASLRADPLNLPVTVTASLGITALWLLPHLRDFQSRYPDIDVRLASSNRVVDLRREGIDLALRHCVDSDVPAGSMRLFGETVFPVASPSLGLAELTRDKLPTVALMNYDDPNFPWLGWADWLAICGLEGVRPRAVLHFNHYDQLIQAAVAGQGVAIGRAELLSDLIAEGRLQPVGTARRQVAERGYWLIGASDTPREDVVCFRDWVCEAAARTRSAAEGLTGVV
ncbi:MAG: LysR family transcriptional regulator [Zoogloea sp.]|nr:LysR family transcriptional regulator [Zoogloea sp.]